jgi:hypothetical protein
LTSDAIELDLGKPDCETFTYPASQKLAILLQSEVNWFGIADASSTAIFGTSLPAGLWRIAPRHPGGHFFCAVLVALELHMRECANLSHSRLSMRTCHAFAVPH